MKARLTQVVLKRSSNNVVREDRNSKRAKDFGILEVSGD